MPCKLPLKFLVLWIANLAVILALSLGTGFHQTLLDLFTFQSITTLYLAAGAVLALLEQALFDKLRGE